MDEKRKFEKLLEVFIEALNEKIAAEDGQWTIKGFIDQYRNIYTISADTKIISKILEIHIFPLLLSFAEHNNYKLILAEHQNYYPDITFIGGENDNIKFAVDIKTTYRKIDNPHLCNGFTLGSHGKYFIERDAKKNIQFPYAEYSGHFCLGIIYNRIDKKVNETRC